jgi:hypothetical protein
MSINRTQFEQHERFSELCALYPTDTLSSGERALLEDHLVRCEECRARLVSYRQLVREGLPLLGGESGCNEGDAKGLFSVLDAKATLYAKLDARNSGATEWAANEPPGASPRKASHNRWVWSVSRSDYARAFVMIAILVLAVGLAFLLHALVSPNTHWKIRRMQVPSVDSVAEERNKVKSVLDEREANLKERDLKISALSAQIESDLREISKLKKLAESSGMENAGIKSELSTRRAAEDAAAQAHTALEARLETTEEYLAAKQKELLDLRTQRQNDLLRRASLEQQISQLSSQLNEERSTTKDQQSLLASDRDIRELMGARDLYITDVFDVDQNSHTQKPFGRVFYTKNKSLIFYAFDLDQQRGVKEASIFQAWGTTDSDKKHPSSLGILYLDNQANRRWVLKCEDPEVLAKINAVFVTLEPHGGSAKPSGRQLLYAYLNSQPNHP